MVTRFRCAVLASSTSWGAPADLQRGRRYSIVGNGEIVNHPELRRELEGSFRFRTHSDIETLLASYFAGATTPGFVARACTRRYWDHRAKTLCLARDPLGIKRFM